MSAQVTHTEEHEDEGTKRRPSRGWRRGPQRRRRRSRGVLAGSPPGAGGRLIDLRPRLY